MTYYYATTLTVEDAMIYRRLSKSSYLGDATRIILSTMMDQEDLIHMNEGSEMDLCELMRAHGFTPKDRVTLDFMR